MTTATLTRPTIPALPVLFADDYRALRAPAARLSVRTVENPVRAASPADISMGDYLKYLEEDAE